MWKYNLLKIKTIIKFKSFWSQTRIYRIILKTFGYKNKIKKAVWQSDLLDGGRRTKQLTRRTHKGIQHKSSMVRSTWTWLIVNSNSIKRHRSVTDETASFWSMLSCPEKFILFTVQKPERKLTQTQTKDTWNKGNRNGSIQSRNHGVFSGRALIPGGIRSRSRPKETPPLEYVAPIFREEIHR